MWGSPLLDYLFWTEIHLLLLLLLFSGQVWFVPVGLILLLLVLFLKLSPDSMQRRTHRGVCYPHYFFLFLKMGVNPVLGHTITRAPRRTKQTKGEGWNFWQLALVGTLRQLPLSASALRIPANWHLNSSGGFTHEKPISRVWTTADQTLIIQLLCFYIPGCLLATMSWKSILIHFDWLEHFISLELS